MPMISALSPARLKVLQQENERLRAEIQGLRAVNEQLRAANAALTQRVSGLVTLGENLKAQLAELKARLKTNSQNSSTPPSSDGPGAPKRRGKKKTGRQRGGQAGHVGHSRALAPAEDVTRFVPLKPEACERCGTALAGEDPEPERHQVIDIPRVDLIIIEYLLHQLRCPECGHWTRAQLPAGVGVSQFGPRVHALVGLLVGKFRQGKRGVQALLEVVYGLEVGLGTVSKMERRVSAALAAPVAEVYAAIRQAEVVNKDETSWRQLKDKAWLWVAATDELVGFWIDRRRSSEVSKRILGETFAGIVCCDRWSAYYWLSRRALCWAHLMRDFVAMVERHGSPWHGGRLVKLAGEIMALWARWQAGEIDRATLEAEVAPLKVRLVQMLEWTAANAPGPKARATARNLLKHQDAMWRWLTDERVPLTNNLAERLLRYAVIWRKLSYGTDSLAGSRYVERLLTAVGTLQLQGRDAYDYLTDLMTAHAAGQALPSLLPQPIDP